MSDDHDPPGKLDVDAAFSCYHLAEASSEISSLLTSIALGGDLDRENPRIIVSVAHLYEHLNWFWHGKNRSNRSKLDLSAEEFAAFSDFPTALYQHMPSKGGLGDESGPIYMPAKFYEPGAGRFTNGDEEYEG